MKKDLIEKEKAMKEIMNKSHSANVAHQTFANLTSVSSSFYFLSIQVPTSFPSPALSFTPFPSPSPTSVPSPSPVLSPLLTQPPAQSPAPPNIPP